MKFIAEDCITKYINIRSKLKWKLFTKVIKRQSKEAWLLDRQCLIQREAQVLLI
jgi:hypothetical protein